MNRIQKQLLTLLALMGISAGLVAYEFDFMNTTEEFIVLKFNTRSAANVDRYAIIPPGGSTKFPVNNLDCFEKVSWAPFKKVDGWGNPIPYNGGLDLVNKTPDEKNPKRVVGRIEGKDSKGNDKQRLFGDQIAPAYSFYRMDVTMIPNEIFDKTVKAAEKLCSGIDTAICQVLNEVKSFTGITATEKLASNIGGGETTKETTTEPKTETPINDPSDQKAELINTLTELKSLFEQKNYARAKTIVSQKKAILSPTLSVKEISQISSVGDMTVGAALKIVDSHLATLASHLDLEGSIIKTSMGTDDSMVDFSSLLSSPNPTPGSKLPLKSPEKCEFGLAKIAGAAGTIAGISLCKARQFQIAYTAQKGNPDLMQFEGFSSVPKLQLITGVGE